MVWGLSSTIFEGQTPCMRPVACPLRELLPSKCGRLVAWPASSGSVACFRWLLGGEVVTVYASSEMSVVEFKQLTLETLFEDEFTRRVTSLQLVLGERSLEDSKTLHEESVTTDAVLLAVLGTRMVECVRKEALDEVSGGVILKIPDGTSVIFNGAFAYCTSLVHVALPESVAEIRKGAFAGCSGLMRLDLGTSLTRIASEAFLGCASLLHLTIPESVTEIGGRAFWGCTSLRDLNIPESVSKIWPEAFSMCLSLRSLTLPKSLSTVADGAFDNCGSLRTLNLPDSLTRIGADVLLVAVAP